MAGLCQRVQGSHSWWSRSSATTKNGFLAPADTVPPLPPLISSSMEQGQDSLETISSGSSRDRLSRPSPPMSAPLSAKSISAVDQIAFRRTYSSNSIKVRQVSRPSVIASLDPSHLIFFHLG